MILYTNLYYVLILIAVLKTSFACTYEKRYDAIEIGRGENQNVTKTRTVCCNGYIRIKEEHNKVICYPECKNCIQGYCIEPSKCICNDGYTGMNCTEKCADGKWGKNCLGNCNCRNGAQCDHKMGQCICMAGWTGKSCEISTMKDRINATNWVRVDDAQEHDKILKNISSVLTKFTESVEDLHKTVADVKTSHRIDETETEKLYQSEHIPVPQTANDGSDSNFLQNIGPPILIALTILLIILTVCLTIKIRTSINNIRKIQRNPTESFRKKLKQSEESANQIEINPASNPSMIPVMISTISLKEEPQKRELPAPPPEDIYDKVNVIKNRRESNSYVPMISPSKPTISPITEKPLTSFIHNKRPTYLNTLKPVDKIIKISPSDEIYEDIKAEEETEYEEVGQYVKSK